MSKKKIILISILCCIILIFIYLANQTEGIYYKSYSPDGQYSCYASKSKYFNFNFPFVKSGDASGKVHVYDELENKLVSSSSIAMIANINNMEWNEDSFYQKSDISIKLPRKIDKKIITSYQKTTPVKHNRNLFIQGKQYKINSKNNRLTVINESGETILKNIKYIQQISNIECQILNDKTEIEYYNFELDTLIKTPSKNPFINEVCGNVNTYGLKIEEKNNFYLIKKAVGFTNYDFKNYEILDSIKKDNIKNIYFSNKKKTLEYDKNFQKLEYVIIEYNTYFGIWSNTFGIEYFDSIDLNTKPIKVQRDKLYGYYRISPIIYLKLNPYLFNLAEFTDSEHKKGYLDKNGNNYY